MVWFLLVLEGQYYYWLFTIFMSFLVVVLCLIKCIYFISSCFNMEIPTWVTTGIFIVFHWNSWAGEHTCMYSLAFPPKCMNGNFPVKFLHVFPILWLLSQWETSFHKQFGAEKHPYGHLWVIVKPLVPQMGLWPTLISVSKCYLYVDRLNL